MKEDKYTKNRDQEIAHALSVAVDPNHISLTFDAMEVGGRKLAMQVYRLYSKLFFDNDVWRKEKCLDLISLHQVEEQVGKPKRRKSTSTYWANRKWL